MLPFFFNKICPLETDLSVGKLSDQKTLCVLAVGYVNDHCLCYILVENQDVTLVCGFVKSIMRMFSIYYCCNIQYTSKCLRSLQVIQTYLLQLTEHRKKHQN